MNFSYRHLPKTIGNHSSCRTAVSSLKRPHSPRLNSFKPPELQFSSLEEFVTLSLPQLFAIDQL